MQHINKQECSTTKKLTTMGKLENLVELSAITPISDEANKDARELHKTICTELMQVSKEHDVPMSFLVYFMVSKEAHKEATFNQGYKKMDKEKALAIIKMAKAFAAFHGYNKPNDKVYHAMTAYYERKSKDYAEFEETLKAMAPNKKWSTTRSICMVMKVPTSK